VEKRDALKSWTVLLAILTFVLSLIGTFLVRSGVLTSVHAFAVDPARGVFILLLLTVATVGALLLYAIRAPSMKMGGLFAPISREGALVLNNLLLSTATATVFLGTLYPLFLDAIDAGKVSVGPPFFNSTFIPLMVPLVAAMSVGPLLAWKRADLAGALSRLKFAAVLTVICVLGALYAYQGGPVLALLGVAMAAWAFFGSIFEFTDRIRLFRAPLGDSLRRAGGLPRSAWGMTIAHAGMGIAIAGMTGSAAWMTERIQLMRPGDTAQIAGYDIRFDEVHELPVANYRAKTATFTVSRNGQLVATLHPEERWFPVTRMSTTEAAIRTNFVSDLYVVLGQEQQGTGAYATRLYHHPLVPWIWIGCVVMVVGGCVSLSDRRFRIGVPEKKRNRQPIPLPAE
jgi:cytochrome c-type biogenesis protein CcmF